MPEVAEHDREGCFLALIRLGEPIMEKQPNSRICTVCGIDAFARTWPSAPTTRGGACPASSPDPSTRAIPVICTEV
jgi:hypothetical protein